MVLYMYEELITKSLMVTNTAYSYAEQWSLNVRLIKTKVFK